MDPRRFVSERFGRLQRGLGAYDLLSYHPEPLPRELPLDPSTVNAVSAADRDLGRLAGAGRLLPNPHLLVAPYLTREALASSRIEGTQASLSDVFSAELADEADTQDIEEVRNYINAMEYGRTRLATLPLSVRFMEELHARLLSGVRGRERQPGEVRRSPNWIGSPDNRPETAVFVPPPVDVMRDCLTDWERFVNDPPELPLLVRCGLLHYQFETIHPFLDGNGRLGRLFVVLYLLAEGELPQPLLYISSYLERHRAEYYERLQAVRERGDMEQWLLFFVTAVRTQAVDAVERAERLLDLREQLRDEAARRSRSRARDVVDMLFENPFVTARRIAQRLGVTYQTGHNLANELERMGGLEPSSPGRGGAKRWHAPQVLAVLES